MRRIKKSNHLRTVQGNPSGRPLADREPDSELVTTPEPPESLKGDARAIWTEYCAILEGMRTLTKGDLMALENLCRVQADVMQADRDILENGLVVATGAGGLKKNPAQAIKLAAIQQARLYMVELGLTPASRTRVSVIPEKEHDALGEFLAEGDRMRKERMDKYKGA